MTNLLYSPDRLARVLEREGFDAIVVATPPNVLYLTRYRKGGAALAVVLRAAPDRPLLVLPASDVDFVLEDLADPVEVRAHGRFVRYRADGVRLTGRDARVDAIASAARPDVDRLGVLAEHLRESGVAGAIAADVLPGALGEAGVEHRPDLLRELRRVKTDEEVDRLARAAEITEAAIERTNRCVRDAATQAELAREFCVAVAEAGSRLRMDNVSIGAGSALGNVNQPADLVRGGAIIRYDVGVIHEGYASDLSRCYAFGEPDARLGRYHAALVTGVEAALDVLRPGVRARELFDTTVAAVRSAGIPHYDRTNVGHGIGIAGDGYDAPLLAPGDETLIEAGMVLCVETPYYELGCAGLQVEDMVVVTDDGHRPLSRLPRELQVLA